MGGHQVLAYVPGSQILGAAAQRLYTLLSGDDAWRVFHSGEVRFGNGLPLDAAGRHCVPIPMSFHVAKGLAAWRVYRGDSHGTSHFLTTEVVNLARALRPAGQFERIEPCFVSSKGERHKLEGRTSLRTALDERGRAREGLLYELSALTGRELLVARIDADDERLLDCVREALVDRELRLGRSRSAELGRVRVTEVPAPLPFPVASGAEQRIVRFLCCSDLLLRDGVTGQPTYSPSPLDFGLPETWKVDLERSFLATRTYSPFNSHRMDHDLERQVIVAGSVITFSGPSPVHVDSIRAVVSRGVGECLSEGLGDLLVEPLLLSMERPGAEVSPEPETMIELAPTPRPDHPLVAWLEQREEEARATEDAWELAHSWQHRLAPWPRLRGNQWGNIRLLARRHRAAAELSELANAVRAYVEAGTRALDGAWGTERNGRSLGMSLVDAVQSCERPASVASRALELLGSSMARRGADAFEGEA